MCKAIQSVVIWALRFAALFLALTASYLFELAKGFPAILASGLMLAASAALLFSSSTTKD